MSRGLLTEGEPKVERGMLKGEDVCERDASCDMALRADGVEQLSGRLGRMFMELTDAASALLAGGTSLFTRAGASCADFVFSWLVLGLLIIFTVVHNPAAAAASDVTAAAADDDDVTVVVV